MDGYMHLFMGKMSFMTGKQLFYAILKKERFIKRQEVGVSNHTNTGRFDITRPVTARRLKPRLL